MLQGFEPHHDELYNCLEDVVACIAKGFEREHMLIYADAWNFAFFPSAGSSRKRIIGNRVEAGEYNAWVSLEKYHGIKSKCHFSHTMDQQIEILKKELADGKPTVLWLDGFYVPWTNVYGKLHMKHFLIVVDMDEAREIIHVVDPYWNKNINPLPVKNFKLSMAKCITFSLAEKEPELDWREIIKNAVSKVQASGAFDAMRIFADEVEHTIDLKAEIEGFEELKYNSPIFMQLAEVFFRRLNFARLMEYLGERNNVLRLVELSHNMKKVGEGWKKNREVLVKSIESKEQKKKILLFANEVRTLAMEEKELAHELSLIVG